jgi:ParB family transcriptional regulator, chromosome partitioning protein
MHYPYCMTAPTKGLGRGLNALLGAHPRQGYRSGTGAIPIGAIRRGGLQPRSELRKEALEELTASIKANGVIQPIVVRPVPGFPHQFEIVAGERRWQAAQLAGLSEIPGVIRELSDQEAIAIALIENIQREELTPAEEARALSRLVGEFSLTHQQVADAVGRSRAAVTNLIRLLDLPAAVGALMDSRAISMGHARALLGLESPAEQERIASLVVERGLSVRDTENLVRKSLSGEGASSRPRAMPLMSEIVKTRSVHVQLRQKSSGAARIVIDVADDGARDAMIEAVKSALKD